MTVGKHKDLFYDEIIVRDSGHADWARKLVQPSGALHTHRTDSDSYARNTDVILTNGWEVYRTEATLFHCGMRLAGQADLLCKDTYGKLIIIDWKRSREIKYTNPYRTLKEPLEHMDDTNYSFYSFQLNMYAYIRCSRPWPSPRERLRKCGGLQRPRTRRYSKGAGSNLIRMSNRLTKSRHHRPWSHR